MYPCNVRHEIVRGHTFRLMASTLWTVLEEEYWDRACTGSRGRSLYSLMYRLLLAPRHNHAFLVQHVAR